MERKKELKQLYKETPIEAGVFTIRNARNGKIYVESMNNLKRLNGVKFMLKTGTFKNKALQEEWNAFGADAFEIEVVEKLKKKEEGYFDMKKELEKLEEKWMEKLKPYGDNGYH
ncbi:MAG: GIY-YIG nuclease family protein [Bacillus sp. (in: firmicutes)]